MEGNGRGMRYHLYAWLESLRNSKKTTRFPVSEFEPNTPVLYLTTRLRQMSFRDVCISSVNFDQFQTVLPKSIYNSYSKHITAFNNKLL